MMLSTLYAAVKTMSVGMKCRVIKPGDATRVTVYTAKWCDACRVQVPRIQELVGSGEFTVELIDVDSEDPEVQRRVQHVRFVPHIEYLGLEISFNELAGLVREMGGAGCGGPDRGAP